MQEYSKKDATANIKDTANKSVHNDQFQNLSPYFILHAFRCTKSNLKSSGNSCK